jgi:hypothetical protein
VVNIFFPWEIFSRCARNLCVFRPFLRPKNFWGVWQPVCNLRMHCKRTRDGPVLLALSLEGLAMDSSGVSPNVVRAPCKSPQASWDLCRGQLGPFLKTLSWRHHVSLLPSVARWSHRHWLHHSQRPIPVQGAAVSSFCSKYRRVGQANGALANSRIKKWRAGSPCP